MQGLCYQLRAHMQLKYATGTRYLQHYKATLFSTPPVFLDRQ